MLQIGFGGAHKNSKANSGLMLIYGQDGEGRRKKRRLCHCPCSVNPDGWLDLAYLTSVLFTHIKLNYSIKKKEKNKTKKNQKQTNKSLMNHNVLWSLSLKTVA